MFVKLPSDRERVKVAYPSDDIGFQVVDLPENTCLLVALMVDSSMEAFCVICCKADVLSGSIPKVVWLELSRKLCPSLRFEVKMIANDEFKLFLMFLVSGKDEKCYLEY
jgi:hypothetical protein